MKTATLAPDVETLLAEHGITADAVPMSSLGYSGATMWSIAQGGARYILKRIRFQDDWLMQRSDDTACREAQFAVSPLRARLPADIAVPALGASYDGDGWAVLMRDIGGMMFADGQALTPHEADAMLRAVARLHAAFWDDPLAGAGVRWCEPRRRLVIIGPAAGEQLIRESRDFGVARGWRSFERLAPPDVARLVLGLLGDITPFLRALDDLPRTLLHGDLKCANMGLDGRRLWLVDWAMVAHAPVACDVAWLLAVNSSVLPWSLEETLERYAGRLEEEIGGKRFAAARWPEQRAAIMIMGLLSYGWGKALDADDGRPDELRWWCGGLTRTRSALGL